MMRFHALEFSDPGAIATALGIRKGSWYWKNQVWESALELVWKISLILALSSVLPSDINWAPVTERLSTRDTVVNKIDMILWNYISATWKYSLAHIKLKNLENGKKKKNHIVLCLSLRMSFKYISTFGCIATCITWKV